MNRRTLLRTLGGAAGTSLLAGCNFDGEKRSATDRGGSDDDGGPPDAAQIPHASEYAKVVNVVEAGAKSSGEKPINPVLEREAGDDTLLFFPPGRYRLAKPWQLTEFSHFGMVGPEATFTTPPGGLPLLFALGRPGKATDLLFEGFEIDFRGVDRTPRPLIAKVDDGLTVRDVEVTGPSRIFRFDVTGEQGSGLVERLTVTESPTDYFAVGCIVTPLSKGKITFKDCHVEGFPNNGLYASPSKGPVRVIGGTYVNNGIANIRVGGDSVVRGATVKCDTGDKRFSNMRGIWGRKGDNILVEDCKIRFKQVPSSDGALIMAGNGAVRNVDVHIDTDSVSAILVQTNDSGGRPQSSKGGNTFENVSIRGGAGGHSAIRVSNQDRCSFKGLEILQTGKDRNGITLFQSANNRIRDSSIAVTGKPLVMDESSLKRTNVQTAQLKDFEPPS